MYAIIKTGGKQYKVAEGNKTHFNNCSDMYLLKGSDSALLIDLSNDIKWADDADKYLRDIVHKLSGGKPLTITFTHNHGDHTGMLHAFIDDADVRFALPRTDFGKLADRVPADRSYIYDEGHTFSLGGMEVESLKVARHHCKHFQRGVVRQLHAFVQWIC